MPVLLQSSNFRGTTRGSVPSVEPDSFVVYQESGTHQQGQKKVKSLLVQVGHISVRNKIPEMGGRPARQINIQDVNAAGWVFRSNSTATLCVSKVGAECSPGQFLSSLWKQVIPSCTCTSDCNNLRLERCRIPSDRVYTTIIELIIKCGPLLVQVV